MCFWGDAPEFEDDDGEVFHGIDNLTVYYLPGTYNWHVSHSSVPIEPWVLPYPVVLTEYNRLEYGDNAFRFTISWAKRTPVVIEACTNPAGSDWVLLETNTLADGYWYFTDLQWTNYPARFYRIRSLREG